MNEHLDIIANHPDELVYLRVKPANIDIFNKIVEAYDNLALVTTIDASEGKLVCWVTADSKAILLKLITKMPIKVELLENPAETQNL